MFKVLVTGATGLIGKSVIKTLLNKDSKRNYFVLGLDKDDNTFFAKEKRQNFLFVKGDCRQYELIDNLVSRCNSVIHLAAPSSFLMYKENPLESTLNTIQSFLNILEAMKKHNVKNIVHASTSAVYEGNPVPYQETMILNPPDLKALSKKINEEIGLQYSSSYGIASIAMRPFSVYGEEEITKGGYANVISLFIWAMIAGTRPVVWGKGTQTRDFIHADDVALAFKLALEKNITSQSLNVGAGIETSFNQLIKIINKELQTALKPIFVKIPIDIYAHRLLSDNSRIESILNFQPKISLLKGIRRVIKRAKEIAIKNNLADKQLYFKTLPHN